MILCHQNMNLNVDFRFLDRTGTTAVVLDHTENEKDFAEMSYYFR